MQDLRSIETNILLDMLASQTTEYLRLADEVGNETEYAKCFLTLRAIQSELEARQKASTTTTPQNNNPSIPA